MRGLRTSSVGDPFFLTFPVCVFVLLGGVEKEAQTQILYTNARMDQILSYPPNTRD